MHIRQKIVTIVTASILLTAVPGMVLIYGYVQRNLLVNESASVKQSTVSIVVSAMQRFSQSEPKLMALARILEKELAKPLQPDEIGNFHDIMERNPDGVWRNRRLGYDGKNEAGIFLPPNSMESDRQKVLHSRIKHIMDTFGASASRQMENIWYLSPHRSEIIFDRTFPDFVFDQQADNDYTQTPWVTYTSPQFNPKRELRFTPPLFDPVPKVWMVSALYPLYVDGQWIGTLGEDMQLTGVLEAMFTNSQRYAGTQHFLLDEQGNYVLAGPWQKQLESTTVADPLDLSGEPQIVHLLSSRLNGTPTILSDEILMQGRRYLAIGVTLEPLGWKYFRLVPVDEVMASTHQLFYTLLGMILLIAALTGVMIGVATSSSITRRITLLSSAMKAYATNHHYRVLGEDERNDEIAEVAHAFNSMADDVDKKVFERARVEKSLIESERKLSSILDGVDAYIYLKDVRGRYLFANRPVRELFNASMDEIVGQGDEKFFDAEAVAKIRENDSLVLMKGQTLKVEETNTNLNNGETSTYLSVKLPLRDESGEMYALCGISTDITERKQSEEKLAESEARLSAIINSEPECIKIVNAQGRLVEMNPAGLAMIEATSLDQVVGQPVENLVAPEYRKAFNDMHQRVIAGSSEIFEFEIIGLNGGRHWMETHAVPMQEQNGELVHLAVTRDVTERKQAEQQLRIAATAFESQEGMMVTDANNIILRVNHAFSKITGYAAEEVIGKTPAMLSSGRQDEAFYSVMWGSLINKGVWEGDIWNRRKDGEIYPEHLAITAVYDASNIVTNYVATLTDITMSRAASEKIEHLAFYDSLTQLPNRRLLLDRLQQALAASARSGQKGALLFLDLDHFKTLNDTLGHDIGDLLLQQVAERLVDCVREGDTVARLGGDEFVVLLEGLSADIVEAATQTEHISEKILAALNQSYQLDSHDHLSTTSIGATIFSDHDLEVEDLLKQADIAMYQAKAEGRNALRFYDVKMQESITFRAELEKELRKATEQKQFELHYQIQVDGAGRPLGAEALIRWHHPERGMISPYYFIPLAEDTGLILPIGQWVLETACAQLKLWQGAAHTKHLTLSVNISAKQLHQADFTQQLRAIIEKYEINPILLKLELTESILLTKVDAIIETMNELKKIGIRFSLDDFGTGYSSLQYLKRLPLYQLKIDQSFVRDIADDLNGQAIVRTIIAMAQTLNLNVIAEGVETESQLQLLLDNGCNTYQGYLFSKPVPIETFEKLLKEI